jgi:flagellar motor switch protein FliG
MNLQDPQLRKAAILVASLQPPQAEALLKQLPPEQSSVIRAAVTRLISVDESEREKIISEFVGASSGEKSDTQRRPPTSAIADAKVAPIKDQGGVELDADLAARLAAESDDELAETQHNEGYGATTLDCRDDGAPFSFLNDVDCWQLTRLLLRERPQTIAVVLSYLARDRAAEILTELPESIQVEVLRCLADLEDTDAESLRVIERELAAWLAVHQRRQSGRTAGTAAIAGILMAADADRRGAVLNSLTLRDRSLAGRVAKSMASQSAKGGVPTRPVASAASREYDASTAPPAMSLVFDDLTELDSRSLKTLFSRTEPELILLALAGAGDRVMNHICAQLPELMAADLRRHIENMGPTRLRDVEEAQHELAALASRLAADGEIALATGHVTLTV